MRTSRARRRGRIGERRPRAVGDRASAASSRSGSGRSPSPHICIARWAGYSSPDSQRSCASSASSPASIPRHHCTSAMSRSAGRARHQMSDAASKGARDAASHPMASSKSVGRSSSTHAVASACGSTRCRSSPAPGSRPVRVSSPVPHSRSIACIERPQGAPGPFLFGQVDRREAPIRRTGRLPRHVRCSAARGASSSSSSGHARLRAQRIEVRSPRVGGDAERVGHSDAAGIGASLERLDQVAVRHPGAGERGIRVDDRCDGVGVGQPAHHSDERRRDAVELIDSSAARAGRTASHRCFASPSNGTSTTTPRGR